MFCLRIRVKPTIRCQDAWSPSVVLQSFLPTHTLAWRWGWGTFSKELHHIQIHRQVKSLIFFCYMEVSVLEYILALNDNVLWLIRTSSGNCDYLPWIGKWISVGFGDKKWYCSETERCECYLHLYFICPKDLYFLYGCFRKTSRRHQPNALLIDVALLTAVALRVRHRVYHSCIKLSS